MNKLRNKLIVVKVLHGETLKSVGEQYGIVGARVRHIVFREIERLELKLDAAPLSLTEMRVHKKQILIKLISSWDNSPRELVRPKWIEEWRQFDWPPQTTIGQIDKDFADYINDRIYNNWKPIKDFIKEA